MANPQANILPVDFSSAINLNKHKALISQYKGFNEKNSPVFGGVLSPVYTKTETNTGYESYVSDSNHEAYIKNNKLFVDGEELITLEKSSFEREEVDIPDVVCFFSEYVYITSGKEENSYILHLERELIPLTSSTLPFLKVRYIGSTWCVAVITSNEDRLRHVDFYKHQHGFNTISQGYDLCEAPVVVGFNYNIYEDVLTISITEAGDKSNTDNSGESRKISWFSKVYMTKATELSENFFEAQVEWSDQDAGCDNMRGLSLFTKKYFTVVKIIVCNEYNIGGLRAIRCFGTATKPPTIWQDSVQIGSFLINYDTKKITNVQTTYKDLYYQSDSSKIRVCVSEAAECWNATVYGNSTYDSGSYVEAQATFNGLNGWSNVKKSYPVFSSDGELILPAGGKRDSASDGGRWFILSNQHGYVQGISYDYFGGNKGQGILLTPWNLVSSTRGISSDEFDNISYYNESTKKWNVIKEVKNSTKNRLTLIGDYLIINTTNPNHVCLDISERKWKQFASDWNNRISKSDGSGFDLYTNTTRWKDIKKKSVATGFGSDYTITGNAVTSSLFPEVVIPNDVKTEDIVRFASHTGTGLDDIDIFINGRYETTLTVGKETDKEGLVWPTGDTLYNPSLLFEYTKSYTNQDLITFEGTTYSLMYYNNLLVFLYSKNTQQDNLTASFVIQGQAYGVVKDKIVSFQMQGNKIVGNLIIADVSGLKFITASPYQAFFWSDTGKTLFSFKGDNMLYTEAQADGISEISSGIYNPATGSLLMSSDVGVILLSQTFTSFILKDVSNPNILLSKDGITLVSKDSSVVEKVSYTEKKGFTARDIELETMFYGAGNNIISVNDCWYIKLVDTTKSKRHIKVSVKSLTDKGCSSEEKELDILPKDWDELTSTYYLKYQPRLQRGLGVSLRVETNAKIESIFVGTKAETIQLSKNNI